MMVHDMYVDKIKDALQQVYDDIKVDLVKFQDADDFNEEIEAIMIMQLCELRKKIVNLKARAEVNARVRH